MTIKNLTKKKPLTYYHIMFGGVPLTKEGIKRFMFYALKDGYTGKDIKNYLIDIGVCAMDKEV